MSTPQTRKTSLLGSAGIVSAGTALSRVLGLLREQVMAYFFGASLSTDAFVTAFRIPNLLRDMFAEGALSSAFVPVFKDKLVRQDREGAFHLADTVTTAIILFVGGIVVLGIIAAPAIIFISAKGFTAEPAKFALTVSLTRLMFVYLLLVSLSALVMGMLNSFGRFGIPAVAPALFNLGMILCTVLLYHLFDLPIYAMAIGVLVGGLGQLTIQLPSLWRLGYRFRLSFDFLYPDFKRVLGLLTPMILGMSAGRVNIIVNTLIASFLIEGSITYLNYSYRLMHFPLGVFAVALGTVALPKVSELAARGELRQVGETWLQALRLNMLIMMPAAAFLGLAGHDVVNLIYHWGAFSDVDMQRTSLALLHYSYGLIGFAAVRVTVPVYYALGDSRLPMRISIATVLLNMALYYPLTRLLNFAGLAAATSVAGLMNFALLVYFLPRKGLSLPTGRLLLAFIRLGIAAGLAVYVATLVPVPLAWPESGVLFKVVRVVFELGVAGALYVILAFVLGESPLRILRAAHHKS